MVAPKNQPPLLALVDELLAEQGRLQTPVVQASLAHDQISTRQSNPANFHHLIPLSAPGPGEQYAFEVDLDACSGCKACVAACHSLNGLDDTEAWRDVGLVTGLREDGSACQQTITSACHHCADPGCLNGCPVLAYEKDPLTGIVRHLDDQCIGCQYCVLKCPYDVPKYNDRLGIVRKCDLCHQRLAHGEAPACAQACPTHAIRIVAVPVDRHARTADTSAFLPIAPDPAHTQPTTRYVSRRPIPASSRAADAGIARPQPAHAPLAAMLVLTQLAVGLQVAALPVTYYVTFPRSGAAEPVTYYVTLPGVALALAAAGLAASVAHLGQPWRAWRVFLNVRRSWLSREAVVFGAWFAVLAAAFALHLPSAAALPAALTGLRLPVATLALVLGGAGVACSAMIYADTNRHAWRAPVVFGRFFGTVAVGAAVGWSPLAGALVVAARLLADLAAHRRGPASARMLATGRLFFAFRLRWFLGVLGALFLVSAAAGGAPTWLIGAAFAAAGELAERAWFFRSVDASKMPGVATR